MRIGVVVLPELTWTEQESQWRRLDEWGFHSAWTYDHLAWRSLADSPWFATVPTLAAAAVVTRRIRLGTWVASPNFRHPVPFAKELMTLDDLSGGRFQLGVGAGGEEFDATVLGDRELPAGRRVARFAEFVELLDTLLTQPTTTYAGEWYRAVDARLVPGCVQRPRLPFVVAANGPKAMRTVARFGQGWATTGVTTSGDGEQRWWSALAGAVTRLDEALAAEGRAPGDVQRFLSVDASGTFALQSVEALRDALGRAEQLGFAEVVVHWPRPEGVYQGDERVLEAVATDVLPGLEPATPGAPDVSQPPREGQTDRSHQ
jgi:alkanesulfonate monooxygenase SsuD/methylene tetrahydromethanopterin reductase-like flavin-dependent oxidoreductase (luciferase family)